MEPKLSSDSKVTVVQVILPTHANAAGNMHGGEVMKIMDTAAFIVAQRHAHHNVVTLSVDKLIFKEPIFVGDLIICDAEIIYTGTSTMEVYITIKIENLNNGEIKQALEGYFVMVAIDRNGRPVKIPSLKLETDEHKKRFEKGKQRLEKMKSKKDDGVVKDGDIESCVTSVAI